MNPAAILSYQRQVKLNNGYAGCTRSKPTATPVSCASRLRLYNNEKADSCKPDMFVLTGYLDTRAVDSFCLKKVWYIK